MAGIHKHRLRSGQNQIKSERKIIQVKLVAIHKAGIS